MFLLRRGVRERTTPIGALHHAMMRWGEAERTSSRLAVQRWVDGVAYVDVQARTFADFWTRQNEKALAADGPLWVVLGDSTAQGLGASSPLHGYVGQVLNALRRTGSPWRVLNLSRSGAQTRHVLADQLPLVDGLTPALVTCGIGNNDILGDAAEAVPRPPAAGDRAAAVLVGGDGPDRPRPPLAHRRRRAARTSPASTN